MALTRKEFEEIVARYDGSYLFVNNTNLQLQDRETISKESKRLYDCASNIGYPTFIELNNEYVFLNENNFVEHENDEQIDSKTGLTFRTLKYISKLSDISDLLERNANKTRK